MDRTASVQDHTINVAEEGARIALRELEAVANIFYATYFGPQNRSTP